MTVAESETTAVGNLYRDYAPFLRNIALRKFRIPAEDVNGIVNDVFVGLLRARDHVRHPEKWLIGAVCNASRYYWRQHRPLDAMTESSGDHETERLHTLLAVHAVLKRLDLKCRDLLEEHYVAGYSATEMAIRRGTTEGYAQQMLHRCLKNARRMVKKEQHETSR
jgi:RNA polymerase sigma factor (sigma-70 family)